MQKNREIYVPPEGPPQIWPSKEIYSRMGEDKIFKMLEDFYIELSHSRIAHLFPGDVVAASKKSAAFFVGLLGGPPLYHQQYGQPMMRRRHFQFEIDEPARAEWLNCFYRILEGAETKYNFPAEHLQQFKDFLREFSGWMVNKK